VGTLSANVLGTSNLLSLARRCAVGSFLFFSSGDVYGVVDQTLPSVAEHNYGYLDPTDVRSCYGESKRMGETMCVSWAHQYGIPVRIVRPFHTYGPGMRLDDGRVFADFVRDIIAGGPITLHSDGSARRCFCYLADATAGFFAVLLKGSPGEAFNVANPEAESSIAGLARTLARIYANEGVGVAYRARTDSVYSPSPIHATRPDINKIRGLGWSPTTGIERGFQRTVESYRV
jgi:nucleoside-diphosphate-sugar epimerase